MTESGNLAPPNRGHIKASTNPGVPLCLSSGDFGAVVDGGESSFVGDDHSPDVVGESSYEASHCFVAGLALGDLLVEVGASDAVALRTWVTE